MATGRSQRKRTKRRAAALPLAIAALLVATSDARALEPARTLVIAAQSLQGGPDAAVERELRSQLAQREQVKLLPPPALDLEAVQLAIDCSEKNARCLREVAERLETRVLIVPSIERAHGMVALRILYFDVDADESPRTVSREHRGDSVEGPLLAQVPALLDELLGAEREPEPASEASQSELQPLPVSEAKAPAEPEPRGRSKLAPILIGAGGLAAVTAGLVVGAIMQATEEDYAAQPVQTEMQAREADAALARGENQALAATILLGAGAAAIATAGIWFAVVSRGGGESPKAQTALVPAIGPRSAGVTLLGTWEASRP